MAREVPVLEGTLVEPDGGREPDDRRLARRDPEAIPGRRLGADLVRVHGIGVVIHDPVVDGVLWVTAGTLQAEQPSAVGLVVAEQEAGLAFAAQDASAELGVLHLDRPPAAIAVPGTQSRPRVAQAERPGVAEPDLGKEVDLGLLGAPVVNGKPRHEVVGRGLGVFDRHIEVALAVEHSGVDELEFGIALAAAAVLTHQPVVGKLPLRVLVEHLQIRVRGCRVEVEVVFLDVLAVVSLLAAEAEHPLLEDRVTAVPQRQRQAKPLAVVADSGDTLLTPPVRLAAGHVVGGEAPGRALGAVVLAHRPPLSLGDVRSPPAPLVTRLQTISFCPHAG